MSTHRPAGSKQGGAPGAALVIFPPHVGSAQFEADQGPKNPWSMSVGVSSALHKHFDLFAEYGFSPGDLIFLAGGLTFRI